MKIRKKSAISFIFLALMSWMGRNNAFAATEPDGICTCDLKSGDRKYSGVRFKTNMYDCLHKSYVNILPGRIKDKDGNPIGPNRGFKKVGSCSFEKIVVSSN